MSTESRDHRSASAVDAYTHMLWDGLEGYACLALGTGPHLEKGKYQHEGFEHRFFRWPQQSKKLSRLALDMSGDSDIWVCPMLRTKPARRLGTGAGGKHLWADVDRRTDAEASQLVDRLLQRSGSFSVASGTPEHQHLYIALKKRAPADLISSLNHRLATTIGADAKWDETALLRLPGTLNHKARAAGGIATPVRLARRAT